MTKYMMTGRYTKLIEARKVELDRQQALIDAGVVPAPEPVEDIFDVLEREAMEARVEREVFEKIGGHEGLAALEGELKTAKAFDSVEALMAHLHAK